MDNLSCAANTARSLLRKQGSNTILNSDIKQPLLSKAEAESPIPDSRINTNAPMCELCASQGIMILAMKNSKYCTTCAPQPCVLCMNKRRRVLTEAGQLYCSSCLQQIKENRGESSSSQQNPIQNITPVEQGIVAPETTEISTTPVPQRPTIPPMNHQTNLRDLIETQGMFTPQERRRDCCICLQPVHKKDLRFVDNCPHYYCMPCITRYTRTKDREHLARICAVCRTPYNRISKRMMYRGQQVDNPSLFRDDTRQPSLAEPLDQRYEQLLPLADFSHVQRNAALPVNIMHDNNVVENDQFLPQDDHVSTVSSMTAINNLLNPNNSPRSVSSLSSSSMQRRLRHNNPSTHSSSSVSSAASSSQQLMASGRYHATIFKNCRSIFNIDMPERRDISVTMAKFKVVELHNENAQTFLTNRRPDFLDTADNESELRFLFMEEVNREVTLPYSLVDELQNMIQCRHTLSDSDTLDYTAECSKNLMRRLNLPADYIAWANNYAPIIAFYRWKTVHEVTNPNSRISFQNRYRLATYTRINNLLLPITPLILYMIYTFIGLLFQSLLQLHTFIETPYFIISMSFLLKTVLYPIIVETLRRTVVTTSGLQHLSSIRFYNTFMLLVVIIWYYMFDGWPEIAKNILLREVVCCFCPYIPATIIRILSYYAFSDL
jgi:hypothetical protein